MRKTITQQDNFGCSIACLASLLHFSYRKASRHFNKQRARNGGFYCKKVVEILRKYNKNFSSKYLTPRLRNKIYQNSTIVYIEKSKKYPAGHYLVRDKNMWMDPWINFQESHDIKKAKSGFRKRLPGRPIYAISSNKYFIQR